MTASVCYVGQCLLISGGDQVCYVYKIPTSVCSVVKCLPGGGQCLFLSDSGQCVMLDNVYQVADSVCFAGKCLSGGGQCLVLLENVCQVADSVCCAGKCLSLPGSEQICYVGKCLPGNEQGGEQCLLYWEMSTGTGGGQCVSLCLLENSCHGTVGWRILVNILLSITL